MTNRAVALTPASAIQVRPVKWLWSERVPLAALTLLGGREGIGKSILSYTVAADVTCGRLPGAHNGRPKGVIVAATEDSWEHTIVPRLIGAKADLDRVFRVDVTTGDGLDSALCLPRDLEGLELAIDEADAALVLLDPLLSRLDSSLDTHKDADVRRALEPLSKIAVDKSVAVLGLIHVNKSTSTDALTMLMASRAFAAVARAVLFLMVHPEDDRIRLLGQAKNNLGKADIPTLSFRIQPDHVANTPEGEVWTGRLEWTGESERSLRDALEAAAANVGDRSATSEAAEWLQDYLESKDGKCESALIKREGAKVGHSLDVLKRAKRKLGIGATSFGFPRRTYWTLPQSERRSEHQSGETHQLHSLHQLKAVGAIGAVSAVVKELGGHRPN
jgi:hypothetical protein